MSPLRRMLQVMAYVDQEDQRDRDVPVKRSDIVEFYGESDRAFETQCQYLSGKGWLEARMGRGGGYVMTPGARRSGPVALIKEAHSDEDRWLIPLISGASKQKISFRGFIPLLTPPSSREA